MKLRTLSNFTIILLLVFVTTNTVGTFGYAWCLGNDGHVKIEKISAGGCADKSSECNDSPNSGVSTQIFTDNNHCGPCLDFFIVNSEATLAKRLHKYSKTFIEIKAPDANLSTPSRRVVDIAFSSQEPRISQTILAHRTVVLLN